MRRELTINRLGAQGDGVAETPEGPVYIPFTLPGERVAAEVEKGRGSAPEILTASPQRTPPICRHFGVCGGCALQHLEPGAYLAWKRERVVDALRMEGIEAAVEPVRAFAPHTRRRAAFAAVKAAGGLTFGYRRAQSHEVIDLQECPLLLPGFEAALPAIRAVVDALLPAGEARVTVTACDNGLDVDIDAAKGKLRPFTSAHGKMAEAAAIIRLTAGGDPLLTMAAPQLSLSGSLVQPPPRAFLQASAMAETAMGEIALDALGKARKAADLFCGLGTFSFALARRASVTAVENDRALLGALDAAIRRTQGIKPIRTLPRDLMREPLSAAELNAFDAVLFDPPRAGALAQANALAKSRVPLVIAVSCNPASFTRDARALIDGGYKLQRVVPIDQFVFSAHVELVAILTRAGNNKGWSPLLPWGEGWGEGGGAGDRYNPSPGAC
jgi:23S rRNA (uracil1939-C5)-methyltransferase